MISAEKVAAAIERWGREDPRTAALIQQRAIDLMTAEADEEPRWWWLSFATDEGFLGLVIVQARGYMTAVTYASLLGINPGGEVAGWPIPAEAGDPPPQYRNTLLDKATAEHLAEHGWEVSK